MVTISYGFVNRAKWAAQVVTVALQGTGFGGRSCNAHVILLAYATVLLIRFLCFLFCSFAWTAGGAKSGPVRGRAVSSSSAQRRVPAILQAQVKPLERGCPGGPTGISTGLGAGRLWKPVGWCYCAI
jgi:hypothetical protein